MDSEFFFSIWPFILGTFIGLVAFVLPRYLRAKSAQEPPFELTPNCLLTRLPVMLLTEADPPPIKAAHRFDMIFQMLKEHGYKTEWTQIPTEFQSQPEIKKQMKDLLQELKAESLSCHFFLSPEMMSIFKQVNSENTELSSVVGSESILNFPEPRLVLHRAQELAEQDFIETSLK